MGNQPSNRYDEQQDVLGHIDITEEDFTPPSSAADVEFQKDDPSNKLLSRGENEVKRTSGALEDQFEPLNYGTLEDLSQDMSSKEGEVNGIDELLKANVHQEPDEEEEDLELSEKIARYFVAPALLILLIVFGLLSTSVVSLGDTLVEDNTAALENIDTGDTSWMIVATTLVFLMTPGVGFFYGGMVSPRNIISSLMQAYVCMGSVTLVWFICGFSLAFGDNIGGVIGSPATFFLYKDVTLAPNDDYADSIPFILYSLFQLMFAMMTPAQISGALAERLNFHAWLIFVPAWVILVYCPLAHLVWHPEGLLARWGILDYAGGVVVHMSSGFAALVGAQVLGKRRVVELVPANIPLVLLGLALTWGGWFAFNGGSALCAAGAGAESATHAVLVTHLSASAAMAAWLLVDFARGLHIGALAACSGAFVGLVVITPGAGYVSGGSAIVIGAIGAIASNVAMGYLKETERLDDALDVFAANGIGGVVGMLLLSFFAEEELAGFNGVFFGGGLVFFFKTLVVVLVIPTYVAGVTWLILKATGMFFTLRVNSWEEAIGLDLAHHGHDTPDAVRSRKNTLADLERMGVDISVAMKRSRSKTSLSRSRQGSFHLSRQISNKSLDQLRLSHQRNLMNDGLSKSRSTPNQLSEAGKMPSIPTNQPKQQMSSPNQLSSLQNSPQLPSRKPSASIQSLPDISLRPSAMKNSSHFQTESPRSIMRKNSSSTSKPFFQASQEGEARSASPRERRREQKQPALVKNEQQKELAARLPRPPSRPTLVGPALRREGTGRRRETLTTTGLPPPLSQQQQREAAAVVDGGSRPQRSATTPDLTTGGTVHRSGGGGASSSTARERFYVPLKK